MTDALFRLVRIALKVAYDGARFAGSQVQPQVATVHAELAQALEKLGAGKPRLSWAGRTDAGVSARANVVAFDDPPVSPDALLPGLSFRMEDVWAWAWAEVPEGFEPRHARRRWYRYHLRTDLEAKRIDEALQPFVGTHDFTGFARVEPDVDPRRTVFEATARREGPFVIIDVRGESFLWNQVRRMVEAARRTAAGEVPAGAIRAALEAAKPAELGVAPAAPLVLMDVEHEGVEWHEAPARVFERLDRAIEGAELSMTLRRTLRG